MGALLSCLGGFAVHTPYRPLLDMTWYGSNEITGRAAWALPPGRHRIGPPLDTNLVLGTYRDPTSGGAIQER